jgi:acetyl-CoA carboxylase/biotin carboxylase 1
VIQRRPLPRGHVVAARINAENPDAGFKPNSGKVLELNFRSNPNVWGYFSVNSSGGVHEYADSQFGHIFSYGETRDMARMNLVMALKDLSIRGDFRTTVEYLSTLLEADIYKSNEFTTSWLDGLIANRNFSFEEPEAIRNAAIGGITQVYTHFKHSIKEYRDCLQKGQSPLESLLETKSNISFIINGYQFKMEAGLLGPESIYLKMGDSTIYGTIKSLPDGGILVQMDGNSHLVYSKVDVLATTLLVDGKTCVLENESDSSLIRSPSPGKLVRYLVENGDQVNGGDAIAEIEVMKMFMSILSTVPGIITLSKPAGSSLSAGDIIAQLVLDDTANIKRTELYGGSMPNYV